MSLMFHLLDVDAVVLPVGPDPLDPDDALFEIDRHDQAIVIPLHIEDDTVGGHDAGRRVEPFDAGGVRPLSLANFRKPRVQRGLERRLVLVTCPAFYNTPKRSPGDDPHAAT